MLTLELLPLYMAKEGRDDGLSYIWPKDKQHLVQAVTCQMREINDAVIRSRQFVLDHERAS